MNKIFDNSIAAKKDIACFENTYLVATVVGKKIPESYTLKLIENRKLYAEKTNSSAVVFRIDPRADETLNVIQKYDSTWKGMKNISFYVWLKLFVMYSLTTGHYIPCSQKPTWVLWTDADSVFTYPKIFPVQQHASLGITTAGSLTCDIFARPGLVTRPTKLNINAGVFYLKSNELSSNFLHSLTFGKYGRQARKDISNGMIDLQDNNAFFKWFQSGSGKPYTAWYTVNTFNSEPHTWKLGHILLHAQGGFDKEYNKYAHLNMISDKCFISNKVGECLQYIRILRESFKRMLFKHFKINLNETIRKCHAKLI